MGFFTLCAGITHSYGAMRCPKFVDCGPKNSAQKKKQSVNLNDPVLQS